MARRLKRNRSLGSVLSLDSLLDVVTNINGMLILLAVFSTLLISGKSYRVSFPMTRSTEKAPVFFECSFNRVFPIDHLDGYEDHYSVTHLGSAVMLSIRERDSGETSERIAEPQSAFGTAVKGIDPSRQYAAFLVRPDSFEIFRSARRILGAAGIEIGWEPMKPETPIVFATRGRSIQPQ